MSSTLLFKLLFCQNAKVNNHHWVLISENCFLNQQKMHHWDRRAQRTKEETCCLLFLITVKLRIWTAHPAFLLIGLATGVEEIRSNVWWHQLNNYKYTLKKYFHDVKTCKEIKRKIKKTPVLDTVPRLRVREH